jgi:putative aldouronate transport system permease protein
MKISKLRRLFLISNSTFLVIFALICLVPFINLLAISLSSSSAVDSGLVGLAPIGTNFQAYGFLLKKAEFWRAFGYSLIRVILGTTLSLIVTILAAYPISRSVKAFKGRTIYVVIFIVSMFFNGGLVPTYILISKLGLLNSIWALILPTALSAWNMVILVNFFRQVPTEIIESATLEGAGHYTILFKIILPISLPAIATVALFIAVQHWNSWFDGIIYMSPSNFPLQSYIYNMINELNVLSQNANLSAEELARLAAMPGKTLRSAQIFIAMLPIMLAYPFAQKYFLKGLTLGSVKE